VKSLFEEKFPLSHASISHPQVFSGNAYDTQQEKRERAAAVSLLVKKRESYYNLIN
jgi:hypothetical protein